MSRSGFWPEISRPWKILARIHDEKGLAGAKTG
jgi:hypothetical protein